MKAVIDTNVLVSGMISPHAPPGRLIDLMRAGVLVAVVDDRILFEYGDVLRRPHLAKYFLPADVEHIMEYLEGNSQRVLATQHIDGLPDPADAPFLEIALEVKVALVTGNLRHFPAKQRKGVEVLSPADFLKRC